MGRVVKARSVKSGLPPGTLIHIGDRIDRGVKVSVTEYGDRVFQEREIGTLGECPDFSDTSLTSWINIEGLHDIDLINRMGECVRLHPLVLEDILNTDQRPKVEDYGDYLYIVLKMFRNGKKGEIVPEQVSLILGRNFVVSFQEGITGDSFDPVRERLRNGQSRIRTMGADYLAYCLMDAIVDGYFSVLENMEDRIEGVEQEVVSDPSSDTVRNLYSLKRELIFLRKGIWPLREVLAAMTRRESKLISDPVEIYLHDVYDHIIQVIDIIEVSRDMLSGMLDIYLSSTSNRLNEIMKFLTLIATIFMPLSFLTSLWGMNFRSMPELNLRWGYPAALAIMASVAISMVLWFRKKKWF
jgi:magnesium transporter